MTQHNCSVEQRPARQSHNLEVAGSSPAAAIDEQHARVATGYSSVMCPRCGGPMGSLSMDILAYLCKNPGCQCMVNTEGRDVGRYGGEADQGFDNRTTDKATDVKEATGATPTDLAGVPGAAEALGVKLRPVPVQTAITATKKYRKKPIVVEATQWFKHGDHPAVRCYPDVGFACVSNRSCCDAPSELHGVVGIQENYCKVCPCDWVVMDPIRRGKHPITYTVWHPDVFAATYEAVEEQDDMTSFAQMDALRDALRAIAIYDQDERPVPNGRGRFAWDAPFDWRRCSRKQEEIARRALAAEASVCSGGGDDGGGGCTVAGPGRGDCEHAIGFANDGRASAVDIYGKPQGWCWNCWRAREIARLERRNSELERIIEQMQDQERKSHLRIAEVEKELREVQCKYLGYQHAILDSGKS